MFEKRSLFELVTHSELLSPASRIHHVHSLHPCQVKLPPLLIGSSMLNYWEVREGPGEIRWQADFYECMAPATFLIRDAIVHSSAGIIRVDEHVISETLGHTDPAEQNYRIEKSGVTLNARTHGRQGGANISVLAGGKRNYFHAMIEGAARIAALPEHLLREASALLFPEGALCQPEVFSLFGLQPHTRMVPVGDDEAFHVEQLIFPLTVHGLSSFHPCVSEFFDRISSNVPNRIADTPAHIYIDRRHSHQRRLENEDDLVDTLQEMGFAIVRLETMSFVDQVRLFRNAVFIVSTHGAGLTNIGFAAPGCRLLELHMDAYVSWLYRHLSALRGVGYDCLLGKAAGSWLDVPSAAVHGMSWRISIEHVRAAVSHMKQIPGTRPALHTWPRARTLAEREKAAEQPQR